MIKCGHSGASDRRPRRSQLERSRPSRRPCGACSGRNPRAPSRPRKAWAEGRFAWLAGRFGAERPKAAPVVLPTPEFSPDPYHGRPEDVPPLFGRVCGYLGLDPARFELALYSEADRPRLVGEDGRPLG